MTEPIAAAVLVPVVETGGELHLVFIVRTDHGPHGGQIGFPGGQRGPSDASFEETALREFEEELGIARTAASVSLTLDPAETLTTGFRVTPVIAHLDHLPDWRPDQREVAEVLCLPLAALRDPGNRGLVDREGGLFPCIRLEHRIIWGLTYRILERALPLLPGT